MKSRCILIEGAGIARLGEVELPRIADNEVLVEAAFSCISPGTELRALKGLQAGSAGFPFVPGYSMSGTVLEVGRAVADLAPGDNVFCSGNTRANCHLMWGGHSQYAIRDARSVFKLPPNVEPRQAAIVKLAAIAQRGVEVNQPRAGEHVIVVGLGIIGQLSARLHKAAGAEVFAVDLSSTRVAIAKAHGIRSAELGRDSVLRELAAAELPGPVDAVVDTTGNLASLRSSLEAAAAKDWDDPARGSRLVVQGSYASDFMIDYDAAFRREITILVPRDHTPAEVRKVIQSMAEGTVDFSDLVAEVRPPDTCAETYAQLADPACPFVTALFKWK